MGQDVMHEVKFDHSSLVARLLLYRVNTGSTDSSSLINVTSVWWRSMSNETPGTQLLTAVRMHSINSHKACKLPRFSLPVQAFNCER